MTSNTLNVSFFDDLIPQIESIQSKQLSSSFQETLKKAFKQLNISNYFLIIYKLLKICSLPFMIAKSDQLKVQGWFAFLLIVCLFQCYHYLNLRKILANQSMHFQTIKRSANLEDNEEMMLRRSQIAESQAIQLYRLLHFTIRLDRNRQVELLALEIKQKIQNSSKCLVIQSKITFALFQTAYMLGLFLLTTTEIDSPLNQTYISLVIVFGAYQYFQFYLTLIVVIIYAPFRIYSKITQFGLKKIKDYRIKRAIKKLIILNKSESSQCKICIQTYSVGQQIVVLNCSKFHHFHPSCIQEWVEIKQNCPLCRQRIIK